MSEEKDVLDIILDRENTEPLVMVDGDGKEVTFEQVAVIPYDKKDGERVIYAILKPLKGMDEIGEDEALAFKVTYDEEGEPMLEIEEDELISIEIFNQYYDLLEKGNDD